MTMVSFYPQALYNDLVFELTLAPASQVVRGSDPSKLKYKLTNIQLEYEMIKSKTLADEALSAYTNGKEFAYDHIQRDKVVMFAKGTDTRLNLRVNPQRRSLKGILSAVCRALCCWRKGGRDLLKPRPNQNKCHSKWLTQQGVQQRP